MAGVNDGAFSLVGRVIRSCADQKGGDLFYRPLRRRKPYAHERPIDKMLQPFNGEREMRASLVSDERMDFIYDQSPGRAEHRAAAVTGEQQIERFGSSDNYVRRTARHLCAFSRRSIAGPHQGSNFKLREARRPKLRLYPRQWLLQVALDVVA